MDSQTNTNNNLDIPKHSPFHVGMRSVKTALAATLVAVLYFFFDRNPTFACIGAVFGMGSDMDESKLNGGNRLFGTITGGLLGMLLFRVYICFYPEGGFHPLMLLLVFAGTVLLILINQWVHWPGAIQPASVVLYIIMFNTPVETYVAYSLNRIADTGIGVIIALLVNYLLPRERVFKWLPYFDKSHKQ